MNPLDKLKQKLMVKPTLEERERVAVIIKGEKTPIKRKVAKAQTEQNKSMDETEKPIVEKPYVEGDEEEINEQPKKLPIIVNETQKGYDRATLLKKLKESKVTKVTIKEVVEKSQEKKEIEQS